MVADGARMLEGAGRISACQMVQDVVVHALRGRDQIKGDLQGRVTRSLPASMLDAGQGKPTSSAICGYWRLTCREKWGSSALASGQVVHLVHGKQPVAQHANPDHQTPSPAHSLDHSSIRKLSISNQFSPSSA